MQSRAPTVLVVEDDPPTSEFLAELLQEAGYRVELAAEPSTALDRVYSTDVDVVLLDVMLPQLDGMRLCQLLRALEKDVHLPVIMVTALVGDAARHAGFVSGADDYVTKPFRNDDLLDRLQVWTRARQRLKDIRLRAASLQRHLPGDPFAVDEAAAVSGHAGLVPPDSADALEDAVRRHERLLHDLVAEATQHPRFLAAVLVPYARSRGWDEAQLAAALGCPLATLARLLLCRRPQRLTWAMDVAAAAGACGADPAALAAVLRAAGAGDEPA